MKVEIKLRYPSKTDTTVRLSTRDGTAKAGINYTQTSTEVVLHKGETYTFIDVPILHDEVPTGNLYFYVDVSSTVLHNTSVICNIEDIDYYNISASISGTEVYIIFDRPYPIGTNVHFSLSGEYGAEDHYIVTSNELSYSFPTELAGSFTVNLVNPLPRTRFTPTELTSSLTYDPVATITVQNNTVNVRFNVITPAMKGKTYSVYGTRLHYDDAKPGEGYIIDQWNADYYAVSGLYEEHVLIGSFTISNSMGYTLPLNTIAFNPARWVTNVTMSIYPGYNGYFSTIFIADPTTSVYDGVNLFSQNIYVDHTPVIQSSKFRKGNSRPIYALASTPTLNITFSHSIPVSRSVSFTTIDRTLTYSTVSKLAYKHTPTINNATDNLYILSYLDSSSTAYLYSNGFFPTGTVYSSWHDLELIVFASITNMVPTVSFDGDKTHYPDDNLGVPSLTFFVSDSVIGNPIPYPINKFDFKFYNKNIYNGYASEYHLYPLNTNSLNLTLTQDCRTTISLGGVFMGSASALPAALYNGHDSYTLKSVTSGNPWIKTATNIPPIYTYEPLSYILYIPPYLEDAPPPYNQGVEQVIIRSISTVLPQYGIPMVVTSKLDPTLQELFTISSVDSESYHILVNTYIGGIYVSTSSNKARIHNADIATNAVFIDTGGKFRITLTGYADHIDITYDTPCPYGFNIVLDDGLVINVPPSTLSVTLPKAYDSYYTSSYAPEYDYIIEFNETTFFKAKNVPDVPYVPPFMPDPNDPAFKPNSGYLPSEPAYHETYTPEGIYTDWALDPTAFSSIAKGSLIPIVSLPSTQPWVNPYAKLNTQSLLDTTDQTQAIEFLDNILTNQTATYSEWVVQYDIDGTPYIIPIDPSAVTLNPNTNSFVSHDSIAWTLHPLGFWYSNQTSYILNLDASIQSKPLYSMFFDIPPLETYMCYKKVSAYHFDGATPSQDVYDKFYFYTVKISSPIALEYQLEINPTDGSTMGIKVINDGTQEASAAANVTIGSRTDIALPAGTLDMVPSSDLSIADLYRVPIDPQTSIDLPTNFPDTQNIMVEHVISIYNNAWNSYITNNPIPLTTIQPANYVGNMPMNYSANWIIYDDYPSSRTAPYSSYYQNYSYNQVDSPIGEEPVTYYYPPYSYQAWDVVYNSEGHAGYALVTHNVPASTVYGFEANTTPKYTTYYVYADKYTFELWFIDNAYVEVAVMYPGSRSYHTHKKRNR